MEGPRRRLGELLVADHVITADERTRALENQAIYGGRIGTNLVDLDAVGVEEIGRYLSVQLGVPLALGDDMLGAPSSVLPILSKEQCAHYMVFPLRLEGDCLHLAMLDPLAEVSVKELELLTRTRIEPYVAPELLLLQALEKRYRIPREKRYLRAPQQPRASGQIRGKAISLLMAYDPARDLGPPPETRPVAGDELELDLDDEPGSIPPPGFFPDAPDGGEEYIDGDTTRQWERPPVRLLDPQGTAAALARARDRQAVINHLIQAVDPRAAAAVLFMVRGPMAVAHAATGTRAPRGQLEELVLPLEAGSALGRAHAGRAAVRATAGTEPSQQIVARQLGWPEPGEICVAPVIHEEQVVNLLWVQATAGNVFEEGVEAELGRLCDLAGQAYLRLVKRHTQPALPVVRPPSPSDDAPPATRPTLYDPRFFITGEAGTRSFTRVWRAVDTTSQNVVAIYTLPADLGADETKRITQEGLKLQRLKHPTLPKLHGSGITEEGLTYVVTDWVEGTDLRTRLDADPVPPRFDAVRLVLAIAGGLELAHEAGLLHRDLTPHNVLLAGPERRRVRLVNFGITRLDSADGRYLPAPEYRAPEIGARGQGASAASDVFSLGAIAFEMLAGRRPAGPMDPSRPPLELASVPSRAQRLIARALSPVPSSRPGAGELGRELARALGSLPKVPRRK